MREALLKKAEPLGVNERQILQDWLTALQDDCALFGATAEDSQRIAAIKRRLKQP